MMVLQPRAAPGVDSVQCAMCAYLSSYSLFKPGEEETSEISDSSGGPHDIVRQYPLTDFMMKNSCLTYLIYKNYGSENVQTSMN